MAEINIGVVDQAGPKVAFDSISSWNGTQSHAQVAKILDGRAGEKNPWHIDADGAAKVKEMGGGAPVCSRKNVAAGVAQLLVGANASRRKVVVVHTGDGDTVDISTNSGMVAGDGIPLINATGFTLEFETTAALYCITASTAGGRIGIMEIVA